MKPTERSQSCKRLQESGVEGPVRYADELAHRDDAELSKKGARSVLASGKDAIQCAGSKAHCIASAYKETSDKGDSDLSAAWASSSSASQFDSQ